MGETTFGTAPGFPPAALLDTMRAAFARPGVARAALDYYRQAFDVASAAGAATQALFAVPITVPTLGICGESDGGIAADLFAAAMRDDDFPAGLPWSGSPQPGISSTPRGRKRSMR